LKKALLLLFEDQYEKKALEYFDFPVWVESHITGIAFRTLIKKTRKLVEV